MAVNNRFVAPKILENYDMESSAALETLDPDRLSYSLTELKTIKSKGVFVVNRDFIEHGYRTSITDTPITVSQCAATVFCTNHNEFCNIWSHLLAGLYFLWQLFKIVFGIGVYGQFKTG
jgi:hypothetical protein